MIYWETLLISGIALSCDLIHDFSVIIFAMFFIQIFPQKNSFFFFQMKQQKIVDFVANLTIVDIIIRYNWY